MLEQKQKMLNLLVYSFASFQEVEPAPQHFLPSVA